MHNPVKIKLIALLLFSSGCSDVTLPELRQQGEAETRKLAAELHKIETKEDLQRSAPKLKKRFLRIADLLLKVKEFSGPLPEELQAPSEASEALFIEMARLYEIPGTREIFEEAEAEALHKLNWQ